MMAILDFFQVAPYLFFSLSQTLSFLKVSCLLPKWHNFFTKLLDYLPTTFLTTFRLVISKTVKSQVFRKLKKQRKLVSAVVVLEAV